MPGEALPSPEDNRQQQLRLMLEAVENAVAEEDYEFMKDVLHAQDLLQPFEAMEYMNLKRSACGDPVKERQWREGIIGYSHSLSGQDFPLEEVEAMRSVMNSLQFDEITRNETLADEPEATSDVTTETAELYAGQNPDAWEQDQFEVAGLSPEEIREIREYVVFKQAEAIVTDRGYKPYDKLEKAQDVIHDNTEGVVGEKMLKVFDHYIYWRAEMVATDRGYKSYDKLERAIEMISDYASSELAEARMRSALDKHVFNRAKLTIEDPGYKSYDKVAAGKAIIESYASTPERRNAMFRRLGYM